MNGLHRHVVGVLIAYYPDLVTLDRNIQVASAQVDELYVWDNTGPGSQVGHLDFPANVVYIQREKNEGIAIALNSLAQSAQESGAEWMLTLDQDSTLDAGYVSRLLEAIDCLASSKDVGMIAGVAIEPYKKTENMESDSVSVKTLITSGCLVRLDAFGSVGGCDEQMFIDCVDHELCLKMRRHGFALFAIGGAKFHHMIGEPREILLPFLGVKLCCSNHSPIRKYYATRNRLRLYKRFFLFDPLFVIKDFYSMCAEVVKIIFFERATHAKLNAIRLGVIDAIAGRGGPCPYQI